MKRRSVVCLCCAVSGDGRVMRRRPTMSCCSGYRRASTHSVRQDERIQVDSNLCAVVGVTHRSHHMSVDFDDVCQRLYCLETAFGPL